MCVCDGVCLCYWSFVARLICGPYRPILPDSTNPHFFSFGLEDPALCCSEILVTRVALSQLPGSVFFRPRDLSENIPQVCVSSFAISNLGVSKFTPTNQEIGVRVQTGLTTQFFSTSLEKDTEKGIYNIYMIYIVLYYIDLTMQFISMKYL